MAGRSGLPRVVHSLRHFMKASPSSAIGHSFWQADVADPIRSQSSCAARFAATRGIGSRSKNRGLRYRSIFLNIAFSDSRRDLAARFEASAFALDSRNSGGSLGPGTV